LTHWQALPEVRARAHFSPRLNGAQTQNVANKSHPQLAQHVHYAQGCHQDSKLIQKVSTKRDQDHAERMVPTWQVGQTGHGKTVGRVEAKLQCACKEPGGRRQHLSRLRSWGYPRKGDPRFRPGHGDHTQHAARSTQHVARNAQHAPASQCSSGASRACRFAVESIHVECIRRER